MRDISKLHANCTLYVVRLSDKNTLISSGPCSSCTKIIKKYGIKKIIFSHKLGFQQHMVADFESTHDSSGTLYIQQQLLNG